MGEFHVPNFLPHLCKLVQSTVFLHAQLRSCLALGGTHTFDGTTLDDGLTIAQCLAQLAPATFTEQWKEKIISDTAGNWRLKVRPRFRSGVLREGSAHVQFQLNNLKKINKAILDYYDSVLHLSLGDFSHPDLTLIGEMPIHPFSNSPIFHSSIQLMGTVSLTWPDSCSWS